MKKDNLKKVLDKKGNYNEKKNGDSLNKTKKDLKKKGPVLKSIVPEKENVLPRFDTTKKRDVPIVVEERKIPGRTWQQKLIRFGIELVAIFVALFAILLIFLAVTEYKPEDVETLEVKGEGFHDLPAESTLTLMTWNIGYGALGDNADFFMDGGKSVMTADRYRLNKKY